MPARQDVLSRAPSQPPGCPIRRGGVPAPRACAQPREPNQPLSPADPTPNSANHPAGTCDVSASRCSPSKRKETLCERVLGTDKESDTSFYFSKVWDGLFSFFILLFISFILIFHFVSQKEYRDIPVSETC